VAGMGAGRSGRTRTSADNRTVMIETTTPSVPDTSLGTRRIGANIDRTGKGRATRLAPIARTASDPVRAGTLHAAAGP